MSECLASHSLTITAVLGDRDEVRRLHFKAALPLTPFLLKVVHSCLPSLSPSGSGA